MLFDSVKGNLKLAVAALAVAGITAISMGAEAAAPEVTAGENRDFC